MPGRARNVFGVICWVIAGFFSYTVCLLAFINQPLWPVKLTAMGIFLVPLVLFLLIAAWCRGFRQMGRELGIVLLSASGLSLMVVLTVVCIYASPETAKRMPPNGREMFSAIWSGVGCLVFYIGFGLILVLRRRSEEES